jgi:peptidoglycan/xylan/chitin deacetylase (PgdA/CDA1 family)
MAKSSRIALRIDDIGASTKIHEQYSRRRFLNVGFLRDRRLFGAWGPYREMTSDEWKNVFQLLDRHKAKLTVAITATWVESDGTLVPFPEKFPAEAQALLDGVKAGLIEIANHGLTHCVLQDRKFLPGLVGNNRSYHREFWDWLPEDVHFEHLERSQNILQNWLGSSVTTLVPPGNVFCETTLRAAQKNGIRLVNCSRPQSASLPGISVIGNDNILDFHDRELVLFGIDWLERALQKIPHGTQFSFVKDLYA